MNYNRIYSELINRAKHREQDSNICGEYHHIIPKCIGGSNDRSNIVLLTFREHYIAHLLLTKIYPVKPIWFAFIKMSTFHKQLDSDLYSLNARKNSKLYQKARSEASSYLKELFQNREITEEWRDKISKTLTGRTLSESHRKNISKYVKSMTDQHKKSISDSLKGRSLSESHKKNIGIKNKGKVRSEELKEQISQTLKSKIASGEFIPNTKGLQSHKKGEFKHSTDTKLKLSEIRRGKKYEDLFGEEEALRLKEVKRLQCTGANNPFYKSYDYELAKELVLQGISNKKAAAILKVSIPTHIDKFKKFYGKTPNEYRKENKL